MIKNLGFLIIGVTALLSLVAVFCAIKLDFKLLKIIELLEDIEQKMR